MRRYRYFAAGSALVVGEEAPIGTMPRQEVRWASFNRTNPSAGRRHEALVEPLAGEMARPLVTHQPSRISVEAGLLWRDGRQACRGFGARVVA